MMRRSAIVVLAVVFAACGGASSSDGRTVPTAPPATDAEPAAVDTKASGDAEQGAQEVDYQVVELPAASNFLPLLKVGAEGVGCSLVAEQADGLAYQCEQGLIFMVQKGATLRYACETAAADECGALMTRITEKMLQAAGG